MLDKNTLTPNPSPSGRGEQEAVYRASASKVMVQIARDLRKCETSAEKIMWQILRGRRLHNLKFRRQHPIANTAYVADFLCYKARLVIELDGGVHLSQEKSDRLRQSIIEDNGYYVLRFTNEAVFQQLQDVLLTIVSVAVERIEKLESPSP